MTAISRALRVPVWPFFAMGVIALAIGLIMIVAWWPSDFPDESELVKVSGTIASANVRDDISGTSAGAIMQGWTSTYFTLEGIDGEFRYSRNHPKNLLVQNSAGGTLELWVERSAIGSEAPIIIWQIREHNPYKQQHPGITPPEILVSHAEIVSRLQEVEQSMLRVGMIFSLCGVLLFLVGVVGRRWNQRRFQSRRAD